MCKFNITRHKYAEEAGYICKALNSAIEALKTERDSLDFQQITAKKSGFASLASRHLKRSNLVSAQIGILQNKLLPLYKRRASWNGYQKT